MRRLLIVVIPLLVLPMLALSMLAWWSTTVGVEAFLAERESERQHEVMVDRFLEAFTARTEGLAERVEQSVSEALENEAAETASFAQEWLLVVDEAGRWYYPRQYSVERLAESGDASRGSEEAYWADLIEANQREQSQDTMELAANLYRDLSNRDSLPAEIRATALLGYARCMRRSGNHREAARSYQRLMAEFENCVDPTGFNYAAEAASAHLQLQSSLAFDEAYLEAWRDYADAMIQQAYPMAGAVALGHYKSLLARAPASGAENDAGRLARLQRAIDALAQMIEAVDLVALRRGVVSVGFEQQDDDFLLLVPIETVGELGTAERLWGVLRFEIEDLARQLIEPAAAEANRLGRGALRVVDGRKRLLAGRSLDEPLITEQRGMIAWGLPWSIEAGYSDPSAMQAREKQHRIVLLSLAVILSCLVAGVLLSYRMIHREMELSTLKSDFVDHVAHELRTPIASIKMFSELLYRGVTRDRDRQQEYYRLLSSESGRLARMVDNMLDFSRIVAGRVRMQTEPTQMTDFLRTLQDDLEVQARTTGHQVYLRLADDLPACSIDRAAVSRAISNLISNAIKYSDKDQPIALTAQQRDGYISITVRDRGVGIPASEVPRVFDRFYRAQRTNGDHVQGTGLGLTIVRETMERHGGQVRLESKEGEGTIVELLIPTA